MKISLTVTSVSPAWNIKPMSTSARAGGIDDAGRMHAGEHVGKPEHAEAADQDEDSAGGDEGPAEDVERQFHHNPPRSSPERRPMRLYLKNFMMAIVVMKLISA